MVLNHDSRVTPTRRVAYLKPTRKRRNLSVRTGARVLRVLVENGRAYGIRDPAAHLHLESGHDRNGRHVRIQEGRSRAKKHPLDRHLYAQRHLIECLFSKLKQFRRVATRYEKTARNYLAVVTVAAIVLWIK